MRALVIKSREGFNGTQNPEFNFPLNQIFLLQGSKWPGFEVGISVKLPLSWYTPRAMTTDDWPLTQTKGFPASREPLVALHLTIRYPIQSVATFHTRPAKTPVLPFLIAPIALEVRKTSANTPPSQKPRKKTNKMDSQNTVSQADLERLSDKDKADLRQILAKEEQRNFVQARMSHCLSFSLPSLPPSATLRGGRRDTKSHGQKKQGQQKY